MGSFTILSFSIADILFTILILIFTVCAYLLDLKRPANAVLVIFLLVWLLVPLLHFSHSKATFFRHLFFVPTILVLYYGRGNSNASLFGNFATGMAGLVSALYPDKIEILQKVGSQNPRPCPPEIHCEIVELENFKIELYSYEGSPKRTLLYGIHGASHFTPLTNLYRKFSQKLANRYRDTLVAAVDPRSSLDHPYPAALDDVLAGYHHLLSQGFDPKQVVLMGDSSGGNLVLALCHRLIAAGEPLPAGLVLVSPQTNLTQSGESYISRYHLDPILGNMTDQVDAKKRIEIHYAKGEDKTNPFISPLFGDFTGFPPTLIQVGEYEILYDDSRQLFEKMKNAGVDVRLTQYPGMVHDFQLMFPELVPEVKHARQEIRSFLGEYL
ncbi:MAG: alpha/beta hydrolase [Anaerolineaceae bacterium]|jgi:monoterpene epsilon-lactone hydrolase